MSLYHGTSACAALDMLQSGIIVPSRDGFLYCFDSKKPESMAGALCFATGEDLRPGVIDTSRLLKAYKTLNPDFPKGLKGAFVGTMLNMAIKDWAKLQRALAQALSALPHNDRAAVIVFKDHDDAIGVSRGGFINEVRVPMPALPTLQVERLYIDDALLDLPVVARLRQQGLDVAPLSQLADAVDAQLAQKSGRKPPQGPKL